jgi:membrane protease YdiL (CAAX protease family)
MIRAIIAEIVILGPLSEELIFRGLLLDWLKQSMAVWPAALHL